MSDRVISNHRARRSLLIGMASVLIMASIVVWWPGCRRYPPVSSAESLANMKLLYSACNMKSIKTVEDVERRVETLHSAGRMTLEELIGFQKIIALAKSGQWQKAEDEAFRFAQDQVGVGEAKF